MHFKMATQILVTFLYFESSNFFLTQQVGFIILPSNAIIMIQTLFFYCRIRI